jgi:hypothetical protein
MLYVIMCGSTWKPTRHLSTINGETLIARTVRLLMENGVSKIDICITPSQELRDIMLKGELPARLVMFNRKDTGLWCDCFYLQDNPCTYLFGDVVYSPEAIKTIVETNTKDIEFFASAPPFSAQYSKKWAEPFAFKVVNQKHLRTAIDKLVKLNEEKKFKRKPLAWELWQVIKNTKINEIDYTNYTVINDYTCDIDEIDDIYKFNGGNEWHST